MLSIKNVFHKRNHSSKKFYVLIHYKTYLIAYEGLVNCNLHFFLE